MEDKKMDGDLDTMFDTQMSQTISSNDVKLEGDKGDTTTSTDATTTVQTTITATGDGQTSDTKKSFFDQFVPATQRDQTSDATTATTTTTTSPAEVEAAVAKALEKMQAEFNQVKTELEGYKNHEGVKLLVGDKDLSNVDLTSLFKEAAGVDYSKFSDQQLVEESLKSKAAFAQLTTEEAKEEVQKVMDKMEGMSKFEKLSFRDDLIAGMPKATNQSDLVKKLGEIKDAQKNLVDPETFYQQKAHEDFERTYGELSTFFNTTADSLKEQEYMGYTVGDEDISTIKSMFEKNAKEFDKNKVFFEYFKAATYDKAVAAAEKRGYEKGVKEQSNPSRNDTGDTTIVTRDQQSAMAASTKEDFFDQANK